MNFKFLLGFIVIFWLVTPFALSVDELPPYTGLNYYYPCNTTQNYGSHILGNITRGCNGACTGSAGNEAGNANGFGVDGKQCMAEAGTSGNNEMALFNISMPYTPCVSFSLIINYTNDDGYMFAGENKAWDANSWYINPRNSGTVNDGAWQWKRYNIEEARAFPDRTNNNRVVAYGIVMCYARNITLYEAVQGGSAVKNMTYAITGNSSLYFNSFAVTIATTVGVNQLLTLADELTVWNRSLSDNEMLNDLNYKINGTSYRYAVPAAVASPSIIVGTNDSAPIFLDAVNITGNATCAGTCTKCSLWTNISNAWTVPQALSGTTARCNSTVSINVTPGAYINFTYSINDSLGNMNQTTILLTVATVNYSFNFFLDGLQANRRYEYQTTANITANVSGCAGYCTVLIQCVDCPSDNGTSWSNLTAKNLTYYFGTLRNSNFSNGMQTMSANATFNMDNRTDMVAVKVNVSASTYCYQETANISAGCGTFNNGTYSFSSNWTNMAALFDGNYSSYSGVDVSQTVNLYINYTKPLNTLVGSIWQVKSEEINLVNLTLPSTCISQDPLQLRIQSINTQFGSDSQTFYCYNGSWAQVAYARHFDFGGSGLVYEEGMFWLTQTAINDVTIFVNNQTQVVLSGSLLNSVLTQNKFFVDNSLQTAYNLTFAQASSKTVYANISTSRQLSQQTNLTMKIWGFSADGNNVYSYQENFSNNTRINATLTTLNSPLFVFDNFENLYTNSTGRWIRDVVSDDPSCFAWNWYNHIEGFTISPPKSYYYEYGDPATACPDAVVRQTHAILYQNEIYFQNLGRANLVYDLTLNAGCGGGTISCSAGWANNIIRITDGTNSITAFTDPTLTAQLTSAPTAFYSRNITIMEVIPNVYSVYDNSTFISNISTVALNPSANWTLQLYSTISGRATSGTYGVATAQLKLYSVKFGGIALNKSMNASAYTGNGSFFSVPLVNTTNNISAAFLTLLSGSTLPSQTQTILYLSNNGGTNWEETANGSRHSFATFGNILAAKIMMNTSNTNLTPYILGLKYEIVPSNVQQFSIDLGADGVIDYNFTTKLNETNSPQNISLSINNTINYFLNCAGNFTCQYPITISTNSSGIISLTNLSIPIIVNPVVLNETLFENCSSCMISTNNYNVTFSDLKADFRGSKNYTWLAYATLGGTIVTDQLTFFTQILYSKTSTTFPAGIDDWYAQFYKNVQYNDTPLGQTSTYCNTSTNKYCTSKSTPIWNITCLAYDQKCNYFIKFNQTVNSSLLKVRTLNGIDSTTGRYNSSAILINASSQMVCANVSQLTGYCGIWTWEDLTANTTSQTSIDFNFTRFSFCDNCVRTFDWDVV